MNEDLTPKEQEQFADAMRGVEKYHKQRALKACFERKSLDNSLTDFNRVVRFWCWLKTLICIILNRTGGSYVSSGSFCVLSYDWYQGYESQGWRAVWLDSAKLFSGWQVCLCSDGT